MSHGRRSCAEVCTFVCVTQACRAGSCTWYQCIFMLMAQYPLPTPFVQTDRGKMFRCPLEFGLYFNSCEYTFCKCVCVRALNVPCAACTTLGAPERICRFNKIARLNVSILLLKWKTCSHSFRFVVLVVVFVPFSPLALFSSSFVYCHGSCSYTIHPRPSLYRAPAFFPSFVSFFYFSSHAVGRYTKDLYF